MQQTRIAVMHTQDKDRLSERALHAVVSDLAEKDNPVFTMLMSSLCRLRGSRAPAHACPSTVALSSAIATRAAVAVATGCGVQRVHAVRLVHRKLHSRRVRPGPCRRRLHVLSLQSLPDVPCSPSLTAIAAASGLFATATPSARLAAAAADTSSSNASADVAATKAASRLCRGSHHRAKWRVVWSHHGRPLLRRAWPGLKPRTSGPCPCLAAPLLLTHRRPRIDTCARSSTSATAHSCRWERRAAGVATDAASQAAMIRRILLRRHHRRRRRHRLRRRRHRRHLTRARRMPRQGTLDPSTSFHRRALSKRNRAVAALILL